jgi:signal transduction histidine kinase
MPEAVKQDSQRAFRSSWPVTLALVVALVLVAGINLLWWRLDRQATAQADLVDHTHQVIALLEETLARANDLVIGQRGYALTHEQDFLQPYVVATNRMPILMSSLREMTRDNQSQQKSLDRLESLLAAHQELNRQHIAALQHGDPLAPELDFRRKLKDSLEAIRVVAGAMINEENLLLVQRRNVLEGTTRLVTSVNFASGLVSIGLLLLVFGALRRENLRRREIESDLQRSHDKLEDRVQERTRSLKRSEAERHRLEQEILEASDNEMHRIGRDLHDGVGQQLTALSLRITTQQKDAQTQAPQFADSLRRILVELREIIRQVRILSHGLSPVALEDNGLVEALRKLADDTRTATRVDCVFEDLGATRVSDPHVSAQLFRIGQEAVANALKHAGAKKVRIALGSTPSGLELQVSDDGRGFSPADPRKGLGLRAMKYRADIIGAVLQIDSAPGEGTRVVCKMNNQAEP